MAASSPLHVICGPTASGKTALAIELAVRLGAEIVSADSQQVYRHFDIGTAKPSAEQLEAVPHHLVSISEPDEVFDGARFQRAADEAIAAIRARGRDVVVVGGTGMYVRFLLHGIIEVPTGDGAARAELERLGDDELHRRLAAADPATAARLPVADRYRVIRALEIWLLTGKPASVVRAEHAFGKDRYAYRLWVLEPERAALYAAIDARTKAMFEAGLVDEARALIARGYRGAAAMQSVGYSQAVDFIEGRVSLDEAIRLAAQATRHYAKRQLTWFRKEPGAVFVKPPFSVERLLE